MTSTAEQDLLHMSLSGQPSASALAKFNAEKHAGNSAFRSGHFQTAIRHYTAAEQANPLSPVPPANRAMAHLKLDHFQAAKDDATIALELQNASPRLPGHDQLSVKILLRRATANTKLLLFALAADDYAAVLQIDPSHEFSTAQLAEFKAVHAVEPSRRRGALSSAERIQVVRDVKYANGGANGARAVTGLHADQGQERERAGNVAQDEVPLVSLPEHVMKGLVSKWNLTPPRSALEFEQAWRSLKDSEEERADYLLDVVGFERIRDGVLGEVMTPQLLEEILDVLYRAVVHCSGRSGAVADMLSALTKVARFSLLLMFMSEERKKRLEKLFDELAACRVDTSLISRLRQSYVFN